MMNQISKYKSIIIAVIAAIIISGWVVSGSGLAMKFRFLSPVPPGRPPSCIDRPTAPSNLIVERVSSNQIDLEWDDNSDNELNFEIWRYPSGVEWNDLRKTVEEGITKFSDTEANIDYWYWVRAVNLCGASTYALFSPENTEPTLSSSTSIPTLVVVAENLHIRSGPGTNYDALATLSQGEAAQIIGKITSASWWKIKCPETVSGNQCWVSAKSNYTRATNADNVTIVGAPATPTIFVPPTPTLLITFTPIPEDTTIPTLMNTATPVPTISTMPAPTNTLVPTQIADITTQSEISTPIDSNPNISSFATPTTSNQNPGQNRTIMNLLIGGIIGLIIGGILFRIRK